MSASWNAQQAQAVIYNMLNGTTHTTWAATTFLRIGDEVTLSNGTSFAETRYWGGTSWLTPGVVIDGNLLVTGTLSADKINGGSFTGKTFTGGTFTGGTFRTANSGSRIEISGTQLIGYSGASPNHWVRMDMAAGIIDPINRSYPDAAGLIKTGGGLTTGAMRSQT